MALLPSSSVIESPSASESEKPSSAKMRKRNHRFAQQITQLSAEQQVLQQRYDRMKYEFDQLLMEATSRSILPHILTKNSYLSFEHQPELRVLLDFFKGNQFVLCESSKDTFSNLLSEELGVPPILHLSILRKYQQFVHCTREVERGSGVEFLTNAVGEEDGGSVSVSVVEEHSNSVNEQSISANEYPRPFEEYGTSEELDTSEEPHHTPTTQEHTPEDITHTPSTERDEFQEQLHYPESCCNDTLLVPPWRLGPSWNPFVIERASFMEFWEGLMLGLDGKERLFAILSTDASIRYEDIKQMICDFLYWSDFAYDGIHESQSSKVDDRSRLCVHSCLYITTVSIAILFELNGLTSLHVQRREILHSNLVRERLESDV